MKQRKKRKQHYVLAVFQACSVEGCVRKCTVVITKPDQSPQNAGLYICA